MGCPMARLLLEVHTVPRIPTRAIFFLALLAGRTAFAEELGFGFGSYGRVGVGTDLEGGPPEPIAVVSHAPRVVEGTYVEIDLYYIVDAPGGRRVRIITTPAFSGDPFHY